MTREQWLQSLVTELRPRYGGELPKDVHISVGFSSKGIRSKTIGECWKGKCSADGAPQIFIHPRLDDPVEVAHVVVHELVHACRPDAQHGKQFRELAVKLGLTGRMTSTVPTDDLKSDLAELVDRLGRYPHPSLTSTSEKRSTSAEPKQTTRMLKVQCPVCDYTVRTTRMWLDAGMPRCPQGDEMREV